MTPPGHLAFAYLMSRQRAPVAAQFRCAAWTMLGALLPDIIDKFLLFTGVYPWGRTLGHSVIFWALVAGHAVMVAAMLGAHRRWWVMLGVGSHFLADLTNDIFTGYLHSSYALTSWFLWPLRNPDQWEWRVAPVLPAPPPGITLYEVAVITVAAISLFWDRRFSGGLSVVEVLDEYSGEHVVPSGDDQS